MKNKLSFYVFAARLAACAVLIFCHSGAAAKEYTLRAASKKFYIVDGDSVNYGRLKFRMCGIQAPERFRPFYDDAGRMLKQLFGRKTIAVYVVDIDKYKRKVAVMFAAGEAVSINEKMVRYGGAKHYKRFSQNCAAYVSPARFVAAEKSAKKQKRGIWGK